MRNVFRTILTRRSLKQLGFITTSLTLLVLMTGCGIGGLGDVIQDSTTQAVAQINNAINALTSANADWEAIVKDLENKLPAELNQTIKTELSQTIQRAEATAGTEFKCGVDFVADRVREHLIRIKDELLKQTPPPVAPTFCNVVPLAIDMNLSPERRNLLEFYGYDMDTANAQVLVQNSNGFADITPRLARPTHYHLTLDLGGNPNPLSANSQKIILKWNDTEISSLSVIQPTTPVCQSAVVPVPQAAEISWNPPRVEGDGEYDGHGPDVTARVTLRIQGNGPGNSVVADVYMNARETQADWSDAAGTTTKTLYTAPAGKKIEQIVGPLVSTFHYVDTNHTDDRFGGAPGEPVSQWVFRGDGDGGNDAGGSTGVTVSFNPLKVVQIETANCVSPGTLVGIIKTPYLSPITKARLETPLKKIDPGIIKILETGAQ